jgi:membrane complex biogenesis BtpA family protein
MSTVFGASRALVGVVHCGALPGTPNHNQSLEKTIATAIAEARIYARAGYDGLVLENTHDRPYVRRRATPEVVAGMTAVACGLRRATPLPLGIQVLAGANREALAVAHSARAAFVRVEGFVFGHVADEGWIESSAAELTRYRKAIGADGVRILADIKKKHSAHAVTADVSLAETAQAAEFFLADGVIVSGRATGQPTDAADVAAAADAVSIPVFVGSGVTLDNVSEFRRAAGLIVGSWVKRGARWDGPLDASRAAALAKAFRKA